MSDQILLKREPPAAVIKLNRPDKYNALSQEMIKELIDVLGELDVDSEIRGVILAGHQKFFSTGADLGHSKGIVGLAEFTRYLAEQRKLTACIDELSKPVVAAISGYCLTGGLEVALACDIRIAAENAQFGITSSKIGSVAGLGGTQRLPRVVGIARAKELLFTADFIDAKEADRIGLVNRVVPVGQEVDEAKKFVAHCAERAPLSLWFVKRVVNVGMNMDLQSALYFEGQTCSLTFPTEDRQEGWAAFLEKRAPNFKGR